MKDLSDLSCIFIRKAISIITVDEWMSRLSSDPSICGGKVCIKGTRIMISVILDNLRDGLSFNGIIEEYPGLTNEDIQAALQYASKITNSEIVLFTNK